MTLHEYLERPDAIKLTELAGSIGCSKSRLSQLRHSTEWPPELALKVEAATSGALCASMLSDTVAKARAA